MIGSIELDIKHALDAEDCDYEIETGHRFFCGDMADTHFAKTSPGGILGARFVNIEDLIGQNGDVADIAAKLAKVTWE